MVLVSFPVYSCVDTLLQAILSLKHGEFNIFGLTLGT